MASEETKHLKIFGAKAYSYVPKEKRGEMNSTVELGILVGYTQGGKGYKIMDPKTFLIRERENPACSPVWRMDSTSVYYSYSWEMQKGF